MRSLLSVVVVLGLAASAVACGPRGFSGGCGGRSMGYSMGGCGGYSDGCDTGCVPSCGPVVSCGDCTPTVTACGPAAKSTGATYTPPKILDDNTMSIPTPPVVTPGPVTKPIPAADPAAPRAKILDSTYYVPAGGGVEITLRLPADAVVYINGYRTTKTGTERHYVAYGQQPGVKHVYNIVVYYGGKTYEKEVSLVAGQEVAYRLRSDAPVGAVAQK